MFYVLLSVLVTLLIWTALRTQLAATTIHDYERGLRFVRGVLKNEVTAGRHWHLRAQTTIRTVDLRAAQIAVNGQEVLTKDGVAVKVSLSATYRVVQPRIATLTSTDYIAAFYTELQQALRAAISGADVDSLLAQRADVGPQILTQTQPIAEQLGLVIERVALRDLTFPGELKKIFAEVVKARQEGLAVLERARGETAALRSLANAASMVEGNPHLLQLRLLQVAGQQPGTTLVLGMPGTIPFPAGGSSPPHQPGPDAPGGAS
jgi:regulator of protease activity HflC (stomatin/prohibitin superfamily)